MKSYYVYILLCSDNSLYTGVTNDIERRLLEHKSSPLKFSYTSKRLPVKLIWQLQCDNHNDAIRVEKQIKGWSRKKKWALINEKWEDLITFSKNYTEYGKPKDPSTSSG